MSFASARYEAEPADEAMRLGNAMLDLAEAAMRTCVDAGFGEQLARRGERFLPRVAAPVAAVPEVEPLLDVPAGALDQIQLARILGCLKAARATRMTPAEIAANAIARMDVLQAMRGGRA